MGERAFLERTPKQLILVVALLAAAGLGDAAAARQLEVGGGEELARVNGEPIALEDLLHHLQMLHGEVGEPQVPVRMPDPTALLERIIDARLVVQEAANIGLDALPEVTAQIEAARLEMIKQAVIDERLRRIEEGDPAEVESLVREAVREAQVESVLFRSEESAKAFHSAVQGGAEFQTLAEEMIQRGEAERREEPQYLKASQLLPQVAAQVVDLEPGAVSPPIELTGGWTVMRLVDLRYPDDPEARARAEQRALVTRREIELGKYSDELRSQYARANAELLESLDYDAATPGIEALRVDDRVVVEIVGGDPITLAELTEQIEKRFFHGMDRAVERKRVTNEVPGVLDRMILERAIRLEAKRLGIEDRPAFRSALRSQEEGLIFGTFISKVINPKVKLADDELRAFYDEHLADYTTPEMMRLETLAFIRRDDAEAAREQLRLGADPAWTRARAPGQADPESVALEWRLTGQLLPVSNLPPELAAAVGGAVAGDLRLAAEPDGPVHLVRILESFPPRPRPYDEVASQVATRRFAEKRQVELDKWLGELRNASEIEILADAAHLRALVGLDDSAEDR